MSRAMGAGRYLLIALLLGMSFCLGAQHGFAASHIPNLESSGLFAEPKTASEATGLGDHPDVVIRQRQVLVNLGMARAARRSTMRNLRLNLFPDANLVTKIDRIIKRSPDSFTIVGKLQGDASSGVLLSVNGQAVAGTIRTGDGRHFRIQCVMGETHAVQEIDDTQFAACAGGVTLHNEGASPSKDGAFEGESETANDDGSVFDVLVVYTPDARDAAGGQAGIEALINLAIDETNTSYTNSLINSRVRLVHQAEVSYTESTLSTALGHLQSTSDGFMDGVHSLRDQHGADLVALIADTTDACAIGYRMTTLSSGFAAWAFSVTDWSCATGNYSFGHELGHNMGCHHAVGDAGLTRGGSILYPYSYGWRFNSDQDRTVMAYAPGTRRMHFSNPNVSYGGSPTGVATGLADEAYNALNINNAANTVANWRGSVLQLEVSPHVSLFSSGWQGSPFAPDCKTYFVTNVDSTVVNWSADVDQPWLSASPTSGSLTAGASTSVVVCIAADATNLVNGVYTGSLTISNLTESVAHERNVTLTIAKVATIPFNEGFESGSLTENWLVTGTEQFRTEISSDNSPYSGSNHLAMDDYTSGGAYSRNEATFSVNLQGYTNTMLTFWAKEFGDESHGPPSSPFVDGADFDGVAISEDGSTWYEVLGLRTLGSSYGQLSVDLDAALATHGLSHSPALRVRFNQYDNFALLSDGIAIDDIAVTGSAPVTTTTTSTSTTSTSTTTTSSTTSSTSTTTMPTTSSTSTTLTTSSTTSTTSSSTTTSTSSSSTTSSSTTSTSSTSTSTTTTSSSTITSTSTTASTSTSTTTTSSSSTTSSSTTSTSSTSTSTTTTSSSTTTSTSTTASTSTSTTTTSSSSTTSSSTTSTSSTSTSTTTTSSSTTTSTSTTASSSTTTSTSTASSTTTTTSSTSTTSTTTSTTSTTSSTTTTASTSSSTTSSTTSSSSLTSTTTSSTTSASTSTDTSSTTTSSTSSTTTSTTSSSTTTITTPFSTWIAQFSIPPGQDGTDDDPDADGMTNLEEWIAGTDPGISADVFEIVRIDFLNGSNSVWWRIGTNTQISTPFALWRITNVTDSAYEEIATGIPRDPSGINLYYDTNQPSASACYRPVLPTNHP